MIFTLPDCGAWPWREPDFPPCKIEANTKHAMRTMTRCIVEAAFYRTRWSYSSEGSGTPLLPKSLFITRVLSELISNSSAMNME